jgi:hypothetical protein
MKTFRLFLLPVLLTVLLGGCQTATTPSYDAADGRVTVNFHESEQFTDARDGSMHSTSQQVLDELAEFMQTEVRRLLKDGEKVAITFKDVDLAGDFEPWRGASLSDLRIVKSIYPPRFIVAHVRTGADGQVISQGEERITDLTFQMNISMIGQNDPFHYEKILLRDWVRSVMR